MLQPRPSRRPGPAAARRALLHLASSPAAAQSTRPPPPARLRPLLRRPDTRFRAPAPAQSTTRTRTFSARPAACTQRLPRGATLPLCRSGRVRRRCHRLGTRRVCHCAVPTREPMVFAFTRPQARCNLPVCCRRRDGQATRNSAPSPLSWLRPPHRPCSPTHRRPLQLTPRRRTWSATISGRGILLRLASMVSSSSSLLLLSLSPLFPLSLLLSMI